ncbi:hypothetical protein GCM10010182_09130 [Actinomadura cremea]|nr:hypothetical protein GCM10010182_09130 [Actinomadura cremea]
MPASDPGGQQVERRTLHAVDPRPTDPIRPLPRGDVPFRPAGAGSVRPAPRWAVPFRPAEFRPAEFRPAALASSGDMYGSVGPVADPADAASPLRPDLG